MKPVPAIYSTFLQRAYDQVVHDVCLQNLDVTFALDRAGIVGADGATHQGFYDFAYLRSLPNVIVMAPKDENELQHMLKTAVEYPGPAAVRFPRGAGFGVPLDPELKAVPVGEAELLCDGDDAAVIAIGTMAHEARRGRFRARCAGVSVAVLNARFVKPLDVDRIVALAKRCRALVTVEEASGHGRLRRGGARGARRGGGPAADPLHRDSRPRRRARQQRRGLASSLGLDAAGIVRPLESSAWPVLGEHPSR